MPDTRRSYRVQRCCPQLAEEARRDISGMTIRATTSDGPTPFAEVSSGFLTLLEEAAGLPGIAVGPLTALRRKIEEHAFNLVVAGEFKRGKSTVINALLGADVLPTAVVPLTSVVTLLRHAASPGVRVEFDTGAVLEVGLDALAGYVTERGNPGNSKGVREVVVDYPARWLEGGIRLVDTPGIGSAYQHNTEVARRYLPEADAVIFVASVDQPMSRNELDFLEGIRQHAGKVFCLLNKIDHLSEVEVQESVAFASGVLRDALGETVPVFPLSARLALQSCLAGEPGLLERSRMPLFDEALRRFLTEERGAVWHHSVCQHFLRLIDEARLSAELELRALAAPLALLEANLAAFATKKAESVQMRSDCEALLEVESRKLVKERVEPDLDAFKASLLPGFERLLDEGYAELCPKGSAALQAGLEERLIREVRRAFDDWRAQEDAAVSAAFDQLCRRLWQRTEDMVQDLLRFSAALFAIPFAASGAESLWRNRSTFRYRFWSEPPSLVLMRNAVVLAIPGMMGHPLILRAARQRANELAEMQAGRLRHDFEERIKANMRDFRRDMLERVEAVITGIEGAIEKGRALRVQGQDGSRARSSQTGTALARLEALRRRVEQGA